MNSRNISIALFLCLLCLASFATAQPSPSSNTPQTKEDMPNAPPGGKEEQPVQLPPMTVEATKPPEETSAASTEFLADAGGMDAPVFNPGIDRTVFVGVEFDTGLLP
jgi:hypothetical protein